MPSFLKVGSHFRSATGQDRRPNDSSKPGDVLIFDAWLSSNSTPFSSFGDDPGLLKTDGIAQTDEVSEAQAKQIAAAMQSRGNATDATDLDDVLATLDAPQGAAQPQTQADANAFLQSKLDDLKKLVPLGPATSPKTTTEPKAAAKPPAKPPATPSAKPPATPSAKKPKATSKTPAPGPGRAASDSRIVSVTPTSASRTGPAAQAGNASASSPRRGAVEEESEGLSAVETAGVFGVFVLVGAMIWSVLKK